MFHIPMGVYVESKIPLSIPLLYGSVDTDHMTLCIHRKQSYPKLTINNVLASLVRNKTSSMLIHMMYIK